MYKKTCLDNGLKVIVHPMADRSSLALGIWIKVGGRYESESNKGISHYLEHLLFKGSKKYSCRQIKESIEGIGGSLNGFTSEELTCYLVKIPSRYLHLALGVLSDMVLNPLLPKIEVEKERTVILEELKMYKDQPQSYVYELLDELMWPKQPLGQPIIGTVESLNRLNRQALSEFRQEFYTPANMVISAAGNCDHALLIKAVKKIFSTRGGGRRHEFASARQKQAGPKFNVFGKDTEQTHLVLGFHSFKRDDPLRHALGILHIILGANMSSRLFNEVREKRGLAYEIGTNVKRFQDTGAFIVHAGLDNQKVAEALAVILAELKKTKEMLVSCDEFKRAKEFYLGQLMLALEDTMDHMLWIGETTVSLDKTYSMQELVKEVHKVTRDDVREAARLIFEDHKMSLALIGPLKDKVAALRRQLTFS